MLKEGTGESKAYFHQNNKIPFRNTLAKFPLDLIGEDCPLASPTSKEGKLANIYAIFCSLE